MNNPDFTLHPQLVEDTIPVADLPLCRLLLVNDSNYPWTILVPRRSDIKEAYKLSTNDQQQLLNESNQLCEALEKLFSPAKLNVAALGNMVPQLHVHHIARQTTDPAWPAPVWGVVKAVPYAGDTAARRKQLLIDNFSMKLNVL